MTTTNYESILIYKETNYKGQIAKHDIMSLEIDDRRRFIVEFKSIGDQSPVSVPVDE